MKLCNGCSLEKPLEEYYIIKSKRNNSWCWVRNIFDRMKDYYRDWELKKKYGISLDTYKKESESRSNCCDICGKQTTSLHVDHCHKTSKVRGYLCGSCNRGIGLLQDSHEIAYKASIYLKQND